MKKIFAFMAIAMCAMFFAPSTANAAEPTIMETTAAPQITAAQSQTLIVVIETDDTIIIVIIE